MKKMMTAAAAVALAVLALSGCSAQSAQERAEETAISYVDSLLENDDKDIQSYACESRDKPLKTHEFPDGYVPKLLSVKEDADGKTPIWDVTVAVGPGEDAVDRSVLEVSGDGSCILLGWAK